MDNINPQQSIHLVIQLFASQTLVHYDRGDRLSHSKIGVATPQAVRVINTLYI
jgi:hypothetical protein